MRFRPLVVLLTVPVAVGALLLLGHGTEAQTYGPYCGYSLADTTPGAASDSSVSFTIPAPDYNYQDAMLVSFSPPDGWTARGGTLSIGAGVGVLDALPTLGIANGACASPLAPAFDLYNATTNTSNELGPDDMNWVLRNKDDYPIPDTDADGLPDYLEGYPYFLNDMLDPDGAGPLPPLRPRARYAGHAFVADRNVLIQFLVFDPGEVTKLGGVFAQMGPEYGYPTYVVLNNPISWDAAPGPISDFCSPLETTATLYGTTTDNPETTGVDESGPTRYLNPDANTGVLFTGTHMTRTYSQSERDADGDGWENDLDPCPYSDDTGWDPRAWDANGWPCNPGDIPGDDDCDGLPNSCDPAANSYNPDQDYDGYNNRQDNCPTTPNGCTIESCAGFFPIYNQYWDNQADSDSDYPNADLGPGPDSLGDACDDSDGDGSEDGCGPGTCTDGIDNGPACNGAGADGKDTLDWDCTGYENAASPVANSCLDKVDNDGTGGTDMADPDCIATNIWFDQYDPTPWGSPAVGTASTGAFYHAMPWDAVCVGAADTDSDGYCDDTEDALGSPDDNGFESGAECLDYEDPSCVNASNDDVADDGDTPRVNDGCPAKGAEETICTGSADEDGDTRVNDGCPPINAPENPACANDTDDDGDTVINDGCPQKGAQPETACADAIDTDGDTNVNDGCPPLPTDDDSDGYYNDGCPMVGNYIESGTQCANATSDDTPTPDADEPSKGTTVNDGCPVIGVPESLVIDHPITAGASALPSPAVLQSCSDGVDNDGDGDFDGDDDATNGCDTTTYAGDADYDGVPDASDNCPLVWNPEQTNTDVVVNPPGDAQGDACDTDDDNDTVPDGGDADPLNRFVCRDVDTDTCDDCSVLGLPDTSDDGIDTDADGACNAGDVCTSDPNNDADNDGICVGSGYLPPKTGDNDNCPSIYNPNQADSDGDGIGDACEAPMPVGGIAELPDVSDSSGRHYIALATLAAAALLVLTAGAWYARRRWLG